MNHTEICAIRQFCRLSSEYYGHCPWPLKESKNWRLDSNGLTAIPQSPLDDLPEAKLADCGDDAFDIGGYARLLDLSSSCVYFIFYYPCRRTKITERWPVVIAFCVN